MKSTSTKRITLGAIGLMGCLVTAKSLLTASSLCACGHPAVSVLRLNHRTPAELEVALSNRFPVGSSLQMLRQELWVPDYLKNEAPSTRDLVRAKQLYRRYCSEQESVVVCQIDVEEDLWSLRKRGYALRFALNARKNVTDITVEKTQRIEL